MEKKDEWSFHIKLYPILIMIVISFMSVGYASVNEVDLSVSAYANAFMHSGVFLTDVSLDNSNAAISGSYISSTTTTMLNTHIRLSETSVNSFVTYKITLFNNLVYDCTFDKVVYSEEFYDNDNIEFELILLEPGTEIKSKQYYTFYIKFKYKNGVDLSSSSNVLNALINLRFVRSPYILATFVSAGMYSFRIPSSGVYRIQLWGATAVNKTDKSSVSLGGFTQGDISFSDNVYLHFYVGGHGKQLSNSVYGTNDGGGFNGGGNANNDGYYGNERFGGGGATDVRLSGGAWNSLDGLRSRIMVAAGAGATSDGSSIGGPGGGLYGYDGTSTNIYSGRGGTQVSGGFAANSYLYYGGAANGGFGYGSDGSSYASGGGGGYYGGAGGTRAQITGSGGGGSSFISGHEGCNAISAGGMIHTGQSVHFTGYKFFNTIMIDGFGYQWTNKLTNNQVGVPDYDGEGTLSDSTSRDGRAIIWKVPTE